MIKTRFTNFALSRLNFNIFKTIVAKSAIINIPYKYFSQRLIDLEFPAHLFIEATNACNLKCEMCSRSTSDREIGSMDFKLFKKIIDESAVYGNRNFCLHIFGEPLIAPNIVKMIEYIKTKNKKNAILLTTNGVFLDEEKRKAIINYSVDKVVISLLAANPETYITITGRNDYSIVVENILKLIGLKENMGVDRPIIHVRMIKNKTTLSEIEPFQRKWDHYNVITDIREEHNYAGKIHVDRKRNEIKRYPCYHLWFSPGINWDGDVSICCCDRDRIGVIGNVKYRTIAEIWQSKEIKELRQLHLSGSYANIDLCRSCDVWQTYPDIFFEWQKTKKQIMQK